MFEKIKAMFNEKNIKSSRMLSVFGPALQHKYLWHLRRRSICKGAAIGMFSAFVPVPFQMLVATALCILFRGNLILANALVWITNPTPIPPMMFVAYLVGTWVLPTHENTIELTWASFQSQLTDFWYPYFIGAIICGIITATLGYIGGYWYWRYKIMKRWRKRNSV